MAIRVVADAAGFALIFDTPKELDSTIASLNRLKKDRLAKPSKSWPALAGFYGKGQNRYGKKFLRWLRYTLNPKGWSD